MKVASALKLLFGLILLMILFSIVGLDKAIMVVSRANASLLFLALLVTPLSMALRVKRWSIILGSCGIILPFKTVAKGYLKGFVLGTVTPGKVGDLSKFYFLSKMSGVSKSTALLASVADRLFDLLVIMLLSVLGVIMIRVPSEVAVSVVFVSFTSAIVFLFFVFSEKIASIISKLFVRIAGLLGFAGVLPDSSLVVMQRSLKVLLRKPGMLLSAVLLSICIWLSLAFQATLILLSFGVSVGFVEILVFICVAAVVALVPVTVSGMGTRDAAFVLLLGSLGVGASYALMFSIAYFLFGQIIPSLVGWVLFVRGEGSE